MECAAISGFCDPIASWTHLAGAAIAALGMLVMYARARSRGLLRGASSVLFAGAVVFTLLMSGIYHALDAHAGRAVMRRADHAAIWVLIAATFTPMIVHHFGGLRRAAFVTVVWVMSVLGIVLKTLYFESIPYWLGLSLYLSLGWFGVVIGVSVMQRFGFARVLPALAGGLVYTGGAALDLLRWPVLIPGYVGPHEVFHLLVLVAVSIHWGFIHWCLGLPALEEEAVA